jgi:carboxyl-terminal processing protease
MKNFKSYLIIFFSIFFFNNNINSAEIDIYKKIDLFGEVLEKINKEYVDEINQSESMDSAINGLLQSLDPYSAYMSPKILEQMQTETSGEFGGLGIEVSMEAGVVKVISPIDDTPASKAGLKAGDYIVKINNIQVQGKSLAEAVDLMRGPVGSGIELTVRRRGEKKALTFNITREIIEIQSVKSEILENNIGYIRLTSFNENSSDQIEKQIKKLKKNENLNAFILDLRNNPGGLLSQAITISDFFLDNGEIVSTKSRKKSEKNVDSNLMNAYLSIRSTSNNGLAVVKINRNACGGCFSSITPQHSLNIRMRKEISFCENCGRILVPDDID